MKIAQITLILAVLTLSGCSNCCEDGSCRVPTPAYSAVNVDEFSVKVAKAFTDAEDKVLLNKPTPKPDDTPLGPHPDPDKCICKGTGKIRQGDGHVTPCPYHSGQEPVSKDTPSLIIKDGDITFYNEK